MPHVPPVGGKKSTNDSSPQMLPQPYQPMEKGYKNPSDTAPGLFLLSHAYAQLMQPCLCYTQVKSTFKLCYMII